MKWLAGLTHLLPKAVNIAQKDLMLWDEKQNAFWKRFALLVIINLHWHCKYCWVVIWFGATQTVQINLCIWTTMVSVCVCTIVHMWDYLLEKCTLEEQPYLVVQLNSWSVTACQQFLVIIYSSLQISPNIKTTASFIDHLTSPLLYHGKKKNIFSKRINMAEDEKFCYMHSLTPLSSHTGVVSFTVSHQNSKLSQAFEKRA